MWSPEQWLGTLGQLAVLFELISTAMASGSDFLPLQDGIRRERQWDFLFEADATPPQSYSSQFHVVTLELQHHHQSILYKFGPRL